MEKTHKNLSSIKIKLLLHSMFRSDKFVILGELDKWVPISPQRLRDVIYVGKVPFLVLEGATGEKINYTFLQNDEKFSVECMIPESGAVRLDVRKRKCFP